MKKTLIRGVIAAVLLLVLAVWFFFFRGDTPDAVDVAEKAKIMTKMKNRDNNNMYDIPDNMCSFFPGNVKYKM